MKNALMRVGAAFLATVGLTGNTWAGCVSDADMAALKTAAMQQELMVAAFTCHAIGDYNRFVRSHQPELIASDARLKAYFVQRDGAKRGEAAYHTYKTELANASSVMSLHDEGFCGRASGDFEAVNNLGRLAEALAIHEWSIEGRYHACQAAEQPIVTSASLETLSWQTRPPNRESRRSGQSPDVMANLKSPKPHRALNDR